MNIWGDKDLNSFGTDEFLTMCRCVGAEPVIVVNIGTPQWSRDAMDNDFLQEALHWIEYPQLNLAPRGNGDDPSVRHAIHMPDVIRQKQVIHFYLPGAFDASAVGETARLALYTLLAAARSYQKEHGHPCRAYVLVDEAQVLIAKNIENILAQARSYGVACIMAQPNHSLDSVAHRVRD